MSTRADYRYQKQYFYDPDYGQVSGGSLWQRFGLVARSSDPSPIVYLSQDFDQITVASSTIGGWTFTQATTGTLAANTTVTGGAIDISAGAVTAGQGVNFQLNQVPFKVAASKPVAFECSGKFSGLGGGLKLQFFAGLSVINTTIIAANAVGDIDKIGFQGVVTNGVISSVTHKGAGNNTTGTGFTIVDNTTYKIGFFATDTTIDFYVNGVAVGTQVVTNIPTAALAPAFVVQANATVTPAFQLDWVACGGIR